MLQPSAHKDLLLKCCNIKKRFLNMYRQANAGHVGCSLSAAEVLTYVRFHWMAGSDDFILSKGHAAALLYSTLAEYGSLSAADIATFYKDGTLLAAHPPAGNRVHGIPFATGSLGHGLSLAAGFGLAGKLQQDNRKIFCLTSDGELNEGSTWEAALFIAHRQLTNVVWLIDRNGWQGFGTTEEVMGLEPLAQKLQAWNFTPVVCNGHSFEALHKARLAAEASQKPVAIICNTHKGHGWPAWQDKLDCHYLPMKDDDFNQLMLHAEAFMNTELQKLDRHAR